MQTDHFSTDIKEFLYLLHKHDVQYVIVGGEAVIYYGYPRLTGDVDFFYGFTADNRTSLFNALNEFWDGSIPGLVQKSDLSDPDFIIQFGMPPNRIDLMNSIDGVDFDDAWKGKVTEHLSIRRGNIPVHFLGLKQLIRNKKQTGRGKDLDDLSYLESLKSGGRSIEGQL